MLIVHEFLMSMSCVIFFVSNNYILFKSASGKAFNAYPKSTSRI
jgi:hypothetical protein